MPGETTCECRFRNLRSPERKKPIALGICILQCCAFPLVSGSGEPHRRHVAIYVNDVEMRHRRVPDSFPLFRFKFFDVAAFREGINPEDLELFKKIGSMSQLAESSDFRTLVGWNLYPSRQITQTSPVSSPRSSICCRMVPLAVTWPLSFVRIPNAPSCFSRIAIAIRFFSLRVCWRASSINSATLSFVRRASSRFSANEPTCSSDDTCSSR